jgi:YidC/Oxa1 family membrane protein insertase
MDKNTIIGIILIFLIFIGFSIFNGSRMNKSYKAVIEVADSLYAAGDLENARAEYINALRYKPNQPEAVAKVNELNRQLGFAAASEKSDSTGLKKTENGNLIKSDSIISSDSARFGAFRNSVRGDTGLITLGNNKVELKISPKGGRVFSVRLKDYKTYNSLPVVLFTGDSTVFGLNFYTTDNKAIQTNELYFEPVTKTRSIDVGSQPQSLIMRLKAGDDKYIEYKYTLAPEKYTVDLDVTFKSMDNIIASNQKSLTLDWRMYIPQQEKGRQNEETYAKINYKYYQEDVEIRQRQQKNFEKFDLPTKLSWVAFQDQFFSSVLISKEFFLNGTITTTKTPELIKYIRYYTCEVGVPYNPGQENAIGMKFYYGPNHISTLKKEGLQLDRIIFLGRNIIGWISRFIIIPVFNWLEKYIASYGIIILILTIIIKIVLLPLTYKSYQSTAKMQVLKPMVDEIGKKFPKQEDAMKKQQATMDLYKRAGINPMGGCLPMLLQMPILFAMFRFFPVSIELRQQSFLWATDLSTYDSILQLPFKIPIYGDHVSLFTILMTVSTILTTKMSGSTSGQNQPGMKAMMYAMPIMFMFMLNQFSSGLTYYYFLANMLTFAQNYIFKQFIDEKKVLATLEENRKKPMKKSKWQQRLEEAAKQRGIQPPKR